MLAILYRARFPPIRQFSDLEDSKRSKKARYSSL